MTSGGLLTAFDLRDRSFLKELDLTPEEFEQLLRLSAELKAERQAGAERQRLRGRHLALIFEKPSTRTRCAFEVAGREQGAHVTSLESPIGHEESVRDTARVLGRMFDGIEYRGSRQAYVEELAALAGVPVWNGLTDEWRPTQTLADMLTMREHSDRPLREVSFAYLGDARSAMGRSLLVTGAMLGMDVRIVAPGALRPGSGAVVEAAEALASDTGARITITGDVNEGVKGADFLYTDVWASMREPAQVWDERIKLLLPYQVNDAVVEATGNPAVKFMHCLPSCHDRETRVGRDLYDRTGLDALEVTESVFESPRSIVFDQAENRLHTVKAVMVATLGD
ncbi:ornithine carbamoyltransferase [Nonomuraea sp. K274]|uniref:Ornithine carbamoyltransferase n=1 Tax=Nonomuraea cypriaca TaxID=1187855 RepID=A0A931A950_9ACTN|nr:ornithine carbamoyltransferase [Nonomuraea cypriaca]MBF8187275.1 ornithine carbamoyltransferase [Nonomuraea cypriaca]